MTNRDDFFRDKFSTGDTPLTGSVFYRLSMPTALWFIAQVADTLLAMTIADNWTEDGTVSINDAVSAASEVLMSFQAMTGMIFPVAWQTIPDGYLVCNGATYRRVDYPLLYDTLPSAFIVDANYFTVPDLRSRVVVGESTDFPLASFGGEATHTLTETEIPAHVHSVGNSITTLAVAPGEEPVLSPNPFPTNTGYTGGGNAHNNLQPYLSLTYVIVAG